MLARPPQLPFPPSIVCVPFKGPCVPGALRCQASLPMLTPTSSCP